MQNLKTLVDSQIHEQAPVQAEQHSSRDVQQASKVAEPSAVWKKAFALGSNVRFTRTPEVELIQKRMQSDPQYAARLKAFEEAEKERLEARQNQRIELIEPEQVTSAQDDVVGNVRSVHNDTHKNDTPKVETMPLFISDSAFFEFAPFAMQDEGDQLVDNSVSPAMADAPVQQAIATPEGSITDLYRVLECRFSHANQSAVQHEDVHTVESDMAEMAVAQEVSTPVVAQVPVIEDIAPAEEESVAEVQAVEIPAMEVPVVEETSMAQSTERNEGEADLDGQPEMDSDAIEMEMVSSDHIHSEVAPSTVDETVTETRSIPVAPRIVPELKPTFRPVQKIERTGPYEFPSIELLQEPVYQEDAIVSQETLERSAGLLESVLEDFGVKGEIIHVRPGPVVTLYEFEPAAGVKSSRVIGLSDDIARSMSAISARVAVIPGRNVIGIELPNHVRETVYLRELIQSKAFRDSNYKLALALGKTIGGEPVIAELAKMPHLLVAGTTGSGKSVAINTMILSLLYRMSPEQCRLIMVDPKMLELSIYDGIPHLLTPVVTDPKKAVTALKWAVREMEDRYRKMAKLGVRNIDGFNARVIQAAEKGETVTVTVQAGFDKETGELLYTEEAMDLTPLPYIVVIVDEMADLMMVAGKEIEGAIQRLAQMARAAGIHLIMATQRPSVDVITGTIKANFPTRISFQVTSKIDSRTILGEQGAETLLGQGDMLHMAGGGRIVRVHGPFVSDEEVEHVVNHLKMQGTPDYLANVTDDEDDEDSLEDAESVAEIVASGQGAEDGEELYLQAVKIVMRDKKCSTSYIQRRLGIGYNKAATLVERMENEGLVGAANHVGKREILINNHHG